MSKLSVSRKVALKVLILSREKRAYPTEFVYELCGEYSLEPSDRNFCVRLVRGVVSHVVCLDFVIDKFLNSKISPCVRDALRISTYEILYLKKEARIAVSQGVEMVRSVAKSAAGLANAVLRKVSDEKLPEDPFLVAGFPSWLKDYLVKTLGRRGASEFCKLSEQEPKLQFVANFLNPPKKAIVGIEEAIECANKGNVIIADKSVQAIAEEVALAMKQFGFKTLLEVGAGRGTKTALIESFLSSIGVKIDAHDVLDNSQNRLFNLKEKSRACSFCVRDILCEDATKIDLDNKYDFIFIDTPCTGLGTLRRHQEIKSRINRDDIDKCCETSFKILSNISRFLNCGGFIFYSTCTIIEEENEGVIRNFLSSSSGRNFVFDHIVRSPRLTSTTDAHYCACLRKKA